MVSAIALLWNHAAPISGMKDGYYYIGSGKILGIPMPIIIMLVVLLLGGFILKKTKFGRSVFALGGNKEAARACGINVDKNIILTYIISGLCAALAGIVLSARVRAATAIAGQGYELDAIAAVALGGASMSGGVGTMRGTLLGVLIIGLLKNGMDLVNIQSYYQDLFQGAIIIIAVLIDVKVSLKSKK